MLYDKTERSGNLKKIRLFCMLFSAIMILSCCSVCVYAEKGATKVKEVNVAQYKDAVLSGDAESPYFPISNLLDGARTTFSYPQSGTDGAYITIDLAKRYKLKRLELYSRQDGGIDIDSRTNFKILLSNDSEFAEFKEAASFEGQADDSFQQNGGITLELDGKEAYRYIRILKTAQGFWAWGELKAFADVTVTQITDNSNQITLNGWYLEGDAALGETFSPSKILDGSNDTFLYQMNGAYNYFTVDLGDEYYVDMIEMDKRNDGQASWYYVHDISMYGSNEVMTQTDGGVKNEELPSLDAYGYDKLSYIQMLPENDPDRQFPLNDINKGYSEMVRDTASSYRYLTYKKNNNQTFTELSEFRAYCVNPEIYKSALSGNIISIDFTDKIDESSIDTSVALTVNGEKKDASCSLSDDGYTLLVELGQTYYSSKISVTVDGIVSERGVKLDKAYVLDFDAPPAIDVKEEDFIIMDAQSETQITSLVEAQSGKVKAKLKFSNNTPDMDESVVILSLVLDKNDNTIIKASEKRVILPKNSQTDVVTDEIVLPNTGDYKLRVLVWKDYNIFMPWVASKTIY